MNSKENGHKSGEKQKNYGDSLKRLKILTPEEIKTQNILKSNCWFLLVHDEEIGPYLEKDLITFIKNSPHFSHQTIARREDEKSGNPIHSIDIFKDKNQELGSNYWIKRQGLVRGPYQFSDIEKKINSFNLFFNDFISNDKSSNWQKVGDWQEKYKIMNLTKNDLPSLIPDFAQNQFYPNNDHNDHTPFRHLAEEEEKKLSPQKNKEYLTEEKELNEQTLVHPIQRDNETLADLAFMGHIRPNGTSSQNNKSQSEEANQEKEKIGQIKNTITKDFFSSSLHENPFQELRKENRQLLFVFIIFVSVFFLAVMAWFKWDDKSKTQLQSKIQRILHQNDPVEKIVQERSIASSNKNKEEKKLKSDNTEKELEGDLNDRDEDQYQNENKEFNQSLSEDEREREKELKAEEEELQKLEEEQNQNDNSYNNEYNDHARDYQNEDNQNDYPAYNEDQTPPDNFNQPQRDPASEGEWIDQQSGKDLGERPLDYQEEYAPIEQEILPSHQGREQQEGNYIPEIDAEVIGI